MVQGKGLVKLRGERIQLTPHMGVFIPPGVKHSIYNIGLEDLIFIVVACPPTTCPGSLQNAPWAQSRKSHPAIGARNTPALTGM